MWKPLKSTKNKLELIQRDDHSDIMAITILINFLLISFHYIHVLYI